VKKIRLKGVMHQNDPEVRIFRLLVFAFVSIVLFHPVAMAEVEEVVAAAAEVSGGFCCLCRFSFSLFPHFLASYAS
jgi:hypothetical protein